MKRPNQYISTMDQEHLEAKNGYGAEKDDRIASYAGNQANQCLKPRGVAQVVKDLHLPILWP